MRMTRHCEDCCVDVMGSDEYEYMVTDEVWRQSGLSPNGGKLCVECLEVRIGRPLVPEDFPDHLPINWDHMFSPSENIKSRRGDRLTVYNQRLENESRSTNLHNQGN